MNRRQLLKATGCTGLVLSLSGCSGTVDDIAKAPTDTRSVGKLYAAEIDWSRQPYGAHQTFTVEGGDRIAINEKRLYDDDQHYFDHLGDRTMLVYEVASGDIVIAFDADYASGISEMNLFTSFDGKREHRYPVPEDGGKYGLINVPTLPPSDHPFEDDDYVEILLQSPATGDYTTRSGENRPPDTLSIDTIMQQFKNNLQSRELVEELTWPDSDSRKKLLLYASAFESVVVNAELDSEARQNYLEIISSARKSALNGLALVTFESWIEQEESELFEMVSEVIVAGLELKTGVSFEEATEMISSQLEESFGDTVEVETQSAEPRSEDLLTWEINAILTGYIDSEIVERSISSEVPIRATAQYNAPAPIHSHRHVMEINGVTVDREAATVDIN